MRENDLIRCVFDGRVLEPDGNYAVALLNDRLGAGEVVFVDVDPDRSKKSHRHQFAFVRTAWLNLPEAAKDAPFAASPETLRKHALIVTGFHHVEMMPCGTPERAERFVVSMSNLASRLNGYAVAFAEGPVAYCLTAESQSARNMGGARFQESKQAILEWCADLIGVSAEDLSTMGKKEAA